MAVSGFCSLRWKRFLKGLFLFYFVSFIVTMMWWRTNAGNIFMKINNSERNNSKVSTVSTSRAQLVFPSHNVTQLPNNDWLNGAGTEACNGSFIGYGHAFAKFHNVVIQPQLSKGKVGGDKIEDVVNQSEDSEFLTPTNGYFLISCAGSQLPDYSFYKSDHMNVWFKSINITQSLPTASVSERWTMFVERYEYANLYHTMTDWYNAFLLLMKFELQPDQVDIVWMDGHPTGALDSAWSKLFGNVIRAKNLTRPTVYHNMLWNILGYNSRLSAIKEDNTPYLEEFRTFFLQRFGLTTDRRLDCNKLSVLLVWRRDYLAHPRNPSGYVKRKIKNEDELFQTAKTLLPGHNVTGVQIDKLSFRDQLRLASEADILVGMHGAGLTYCLFLPHHGGLIEFFPNYYGKGNTHFSSMMRWRRMNYLFWENHSSANEHPNHFTTIPVETFKGLLKEMVGKMCGKAV